MKSIDTDNLTKEEKIKMFKKEYPDKLRGEDITDVRIEHDYVYNVHGIPTAKTKTLVYELQDGTLEEKHLGYV